MSKAKELINLQEKEGDMSPSLKSIIKHLESAKKEVVKSLDVNTDNVISPSEGKLINKVKDLIKEIDGLVKGDD